MSTHTKQKTLLAMTILTTFLGLASLSPAQAQSLVSGYNIYYGHLHNHTGFSDGEGTPDTAYSHARSAGLDFLGLSDHAYLLDDTEYGSVITAANANNEPGVFTTFWGFEWTSSNHGHVTVVNSPTTTTPDYCTRNSHPTFDDLLAWLADGHSCVAFFNHPGRNDGSGTEFDHFEDFPSGTIVGMELWNKTQTFDIFYYHDGYTSDSRDRSAYYDQALFNGWEIGAAGSEDNHSGTWGNSEYRLAILAGANTQSSLYTALQEKRFYTTLDKNLELSFEVDGSQMGSSIPGGLKTCRVEAADRLGENFARIELIHNGTLVYTEDVTGQAHPVVTCDLIAQAGDYIYCKVTQADGDEAISSPVFIYSNGPDGPPQAALVAPPDNGPDDLDPAQDEVTVNTTQPNFQIQLTDFERIDEATVTSGTVSIAGLISGTDYAFAYDGDADVITLTPLTSGVFENGTYTITVSGISDVAGPPYTMMGTVLTVLIDTSIVPPQTLHFQSSVDTMIHGGYPTQSYAGSSIITADNSDAGGESQVLVRFDNIVGGAADQIPPYASVISATLRLRSLDSGSGGSLHAMLQTWSDTATWNSLGGGVQADNVEALSTADDSIGSNSPGDVELDVATTVQNWADNPAQNHGWAVLPNGADGWDIASAEHGTADYRPELIVTFVETANRPPVADAGPDQTVEDGDADNVELVTLDGSGSYHPESPGAWITSYVWVVDGDQGTPYEGQVVDVLLSLGTHTVTLTVTDNDDATAADTVLIDVQAVDYDAYVSQEPSVAYGVVSGTIAGTLAQGDGQTQSITEVPNGTAGRTSLQADYLLHTTADPGAVTVMELHVSADWTAADSDDPLQVSIWNGTAWENISDDVLADNVFAPAYPTAYVDSSGDIRVRFSDTAAIKKETKDTLTLDLLYAYIATGYVDTPPNVNIADPVSGQTVYDTHRILVAAGDDNALETVELQIDGAGYIDITANVAGGYFYYDWMIPSDGPHTLRARATDDADQVSQSTAVAVTGDMSDDPPTAGIVDPSAGSTVSDIVTIQVQAQDDRDSGIDLAAFVRIDAEQWRPTLYNAATGYYELRWDTTGYENGTEHAIEAYALDLTAQTSEVVSATVTVDNSVVTPTMSVETVEVMVLSRTAGKNTFVYAEGTVRIIDAYDNPVPNATVYTSWSGSVSGEGVGTTDANGEVTFVSPELKNPAGPTFTLTVTDVVKEGWVWITW